MGVRKLKGSSDAECTIEGANQLWRQGRLVAGRRFDNPELNVGWREIFDL